MNINEKVSVNNKLDRYAKNWSIQVYGNEHGKGHMEVKISGVSYFLYIPTVDEWSQNKKFVIYTTSTKPNSLPSKYNNELIEWADNKSFHHNEFSNLEYCRHIWNYKNKDNEHKNIERFDKIKDISSNKNILNIGNIEVDVIKEGNKYLKFIYNNSTYEYNYCYISHLEGDIDETDFLQNIFENNY